MKEHIIAVGGAGYIGSHVVRELLDAGHKVTVFDNLSTGLRSNVPAEAGFVQGDIRDGAALASVLGPAVAAARDGGAGEPVVIHLAALKAAGESMGQPETYAEHNIAGTISLLNATTEAGITKLVFSSSAAVYGEPQYQPVDEQHPTEPANFYGYTKLAIEQLLGWYFRLRGLASVSLRYFNAAGYDPAGRVYGLERNPANLLPVIMEVAAGLRPGLQVFGDDYPTEDGTGVRDYVHVSDLAQAHLLAVKRLRANSECIAVNLGSESGISVAAMLASARRITGREIASTLAPRRAGDPASLVASSTLARTLLAWQPTRSDADTLVATTWAAYRKSAPAAAGPIAATPAPAAAAGPSAATRPGSPQSGGRQPRGPEA